MQLTIYQCGAPQIFFQLEEQNNNFPKQLIVTAIVNSDAYQQSPLTEKWETV